MSIFSWKAPHILVAPPMRLALASGETYSHVAMQHVLSLDRTFRALADGTRRSMIHALAKGEARSASELGRQFRSAQPTISNHLKVLERAGLIERTIEGRVHRFRLRQRPLKEAGGWIARHQAFWNGAIDQLDRLLPEIVGNDRE
jgi:DNA-binding transcriptional ArsR family regulator